MMLRLIRALMWTRICTVCNGEKWLDVHQENGVTHRMKCWCCAGKGTL